MCHPFDDAVVETGIRILYLSKMKLLIIIMIITTIIIISIGIT